MAFDAYDEAATASFADVAADRWSYQYIASANRLGLVTGISETAFNPAGSITREDMAVIMHRLYKLVGLKADAEARTAQLRSLVEKIMLGQGNAIGTADDIWSFLRTGNFTVDAATKAQAQADIAEDGYWGVEQTSSRILDFAKALTGGDPDKIEEMREAFEKGFKQATETWGGELPEISQRTYDATMKKFDDWAAEAQKMAETV